MFSNKRKGLAECLKTYFQVIQKLISIKKVKEKFLTSNKNREYINKTIHPIFFLYINSKLNKLKNLKAVLELPLIETAKNITAPFKIITIDSTYHKRMNRSLKSKKISKKDFTKLDKIQKNRSFYINKSNYILVNNDTMSSLKNKFEKLYLTKILKKGNSKILELKFRL